MFIIMHSDRMVNAFYVTHARYIWREFPFVLVLTYKHSTEKGEDGVAFPYLVLSLQSSMKFV